MIANAPTNYLWECNSPYEPCTTGWSNLKTIEYTCWTLQGNRYLPCEESKICETITQWCYDGAGLVKGTVTVVNPGTISTDLECSQVQYCTGGYSVITNCN